MQIKNYRLLKDVTIDFNESLTLFVGKNNTGKTSVLNIFELLLSNSKSISFNDYPIECRKKLYDATKRYWDNPNNESLDAFKKDVPVTSIVLTIDYSDDDESYGALGDFIIDLDDAINSVIISINFDIPENIEDILNKCKEKYAVLINSHNHAPEEFCLSSAIQDVFPDLFQMNIATINPGKSDDFMLRSKDDLKKLFCIGVIKAERSLGESSIVSENPLGQIMKKLFASEIDGVDEKIRPSVEKLQQIVVDINSNVQNQINEEMDAIVSSMSPFGYPDGEDMHLKANTSISLEKNITDSTELTYVSDDTKEALPSSHNGLGYKNLIKISMELHNYARMVIEDRTKIAILFIEEPEAHMHPQLQTTFIEYLQEFLNKNAGKDVVQSIVTTHSPHIANAVSFSNIRYIRRLKNQVEYKNLNSFVVNADNDDEIKLHKEFLQKYMKLSYCDLYFCDKAILVEGASERLLIPDMIRKCEELGLFKDGSLLSQYYTLIEVGGAYAHLFYDFVDYLKIPTLIITDIDFVDQNGVACQKNDANRSSNGAINQWCHDVFQIAKTTTISLEKIYELADNDVKKVNGLKRIEFQMEENGFHPRSLEEAIINANRDLFNKDNNEVIDFSKEHEKKTDFAIKLLYDPKFSDYKVPSYIQEGLAWLCSVSRYSEGEEPIIMHKRQYNKRNG